MHISHVLTLKDNGETFIKFLDGDKNINEAVKDLCDQANYATPNMILRDDGADVAVARISCSWDGGQSYELHMFLWWNLTPERVLRITR